MSFSPPSDWADDAPGSRTGMIILGVGGGCLALLLIAGALVSFGTFAAGKSCCDFAEEGMRHTLAPAQSMLDALGRGDDAEAYDQLGEGYREANTFEAFQAFVHAEGDLFIGGKASFVGSQRAGGAGRKYLIVQIADEKTGTVKGTATFLLTSVGDSKKRSARPDMKVDEIHVGIRRAALAQDDAEAALQFFVDALGRGDLEAARRAMEAEMDADTFKAFVEAQGDLLKGGRVVTVDILGEGAELEVTAEIIAPDGASRGRAAFDMRRDPSGAWKITAIRTGQGAPPVEVPDAGP